MPKKKHQTKEEVSSKIYHKKYTNRIVLNSRYVGLKKLKKSLEESNSVYHLMDGFTTKIIYYMNDDHDKIMDLLTNTVKVRRIEIISRPYNDRAQTEMLGDKHLVIVKSLPHKKFRYKVVFKDLRASKPNFEFLATQVELGTMKLSYTIRQYLKESDRYHWWFGDNYFYVEDEATTSMASLLYSDIIKKIYIFKTYEEMKESE